MECAVNIIIDIIKYVDKKEDIINSMIPELWDCADMTYTQLNELIRIHNPKLNYKGE